jgi:formylglycine-generating enzyme
VGCGDAGTCGPLEECGSAGTTPLCVAKKVSIPTPDGGSYFIDATEVTASQYGTWLATAPSVSTLPAYCASTSDGGVSKTAFRTGSGAGKYPIATVDWCDAYGYCKGIGKRLCGRIGGGSTSWGSAFDESVDQWHNACTSGGANAYSYGDTYQAQTCNSTSSDTAPVGSMTSCESSVTGYTGVYDLNGNLWEWEDSCNGTSGLNDICHIRGGSFNTNDALTRCDESSNYARNIAFSTIGFRCCAPETP